MPDEAEQQMELQRKEQQQVPGWVVAVDIGYIVILGGLALWWGRSPVLRRDFPTTVNGWEFWALEEGDDRVPLSVLRKRYIDQLSGVAL